MSKEALNIAVVGATGAVGRELLRTLEKRKFPVGRLIPIASGRSLGRKLPFAASEVSCIELKQGCFRGIDLAFFDASDAVSLEWVPRASEEGAWVVDNSGAFRMREDTPLIVPEVNGELLIHKPPRSRVVAGPNCSAAQLVVPLKLINDMCRIKRLVVSTYQSVSGAGTRAIEELRSSTRQALEGKTQAGSVFPHPIGFNCIPQIGGAKEGGKTSEELKIIEETRKILGCPNLRISVTAVRVPTLYCHAESVNVETELAVDLDRIRHALREQPGVLLLDDLAEGNYPVAIHRDPSLSGSDRDEVLVGRLRKDDSVESGLQLWVVSHNLRKGAALNAVQIGELLVQHHLR